MRSGRRSARLRELRPPETQALRRETRELNDRCGARRREGKYLRCCARQAGAEVAVEAGEMRLEFSQAHIRAHVNSRQRKYWQGCSESSADVHERALKTSLLRHLHLSGRHRLWIAKRVSQGPYRRSNSILE